MNNNLRRNTSFTDHEYCIIFGAVNQSELLFCC
nr:MAG TPA: hypothetical protein [Caudoviricetes sp.]